MSSRRMTICPATFPVLSLGFALQREPKTLNPNDLVPEKLTPGLQKFPSLEKRERQAADLTFSLFVLLLV